MKTRRDLNNQRFERLVVKATDGIHRWLCVCDCGKEISVLTQSLVENKTRSCGCLQKERAGNAQYKHGHNARGKRTPEYRVWAGIVNRCENPREPAYKFYGGRGIKVDPVWRESFQSFLDHVGKRPEGGTLDRIDNNGNYEPGNVRWATRKEQARNRRSSKMVVWKGKELSIAALAEQEGVNYKRLWQRLKDGVPLEKALVKDRFPNHHIGAKRGAYKPRVSKVS